MVVTGSSLDRGVESLGHLRAVEVVFATGAVLHKAHELELGAVEFGERLGVQAEGFTGQIGDRESSHPAGGASEGQIDQIGANANGLKDLSAVIAGQQGNADLGEDLAQPVFQRHAHVGLNLIHGEGGQLAQLDGLAHLGLVEPMATGFPGEPGANGTGAKTNQTGQVVGAPALSRVHNDRGLQAQPQPQQVVVHSPHSEQGRDGGVARSDPAIGEHQDRFALAHGSFSRALQARHRLLQASGAIGHSNQRGEGGCRQALGGGSCEFRFVENRTGQMQHPSRAGLRFQRRTPAAQMHLQAHHQFFPQRIDRRVGDLGEALLEVVVKEVRLVGEHSQGDVIAHAVGGLFAR